MKTTLDRKDLAEVLGMAVGTLCRRRAEGRILDPLPISGAHPRWSGAEVEAWVAAGTPLAAVWRTLRQESVGAK